MLEAIGPWVRDLLRMISSEGYYIHFKYPGAMDNQPAIDMIIFDIIKLKWVGLKNNDMEAKWQKSK